MNYKRAYEEVCSIRDRLKIFTKEEQVEILKQVADDLGLMDREDICLECGGETRIEICAIVSNGKVSKDGRIATTLIAKVCDTCGKMVEVGWIYPKEGK